MKDKDFNNSLLSFQQLKNEIESIKKAIEERDFSTPDVFFYEEPAILKAFKISRSTWYKYRRKHGIKAVILFGRTIYLKHEVLEVIIDQILKK